MNVELLISLGTEGKKKNDKNENCIVIKRAQKVQMNAVEPIKNGPHSSYVQRIKIEKLEKKRSAAEGG